MANCSEFTLIPTPETDRAEIIKEAFQVFECTWDYTLDNAENDKVQDEYFPPFHDFNGITSETGAHFILKINKILMKPKFKRCIIDGVESGKFPNVPTDYGYRDNTSFWFSQFKRPYSEEIPKDRGVKLSTVRYAADRMDPDIKFTDEACAKLVKVPRIFLKMALKGSVKWAKENNVTLITMEHMDIIRDKHSSEKGK